MITVNIHTAKTHLSRLLHRIESGETIVIAKGSKPVAKIVPIDEKPKKRVPGTAKKKVRIKDEFFEPLPEEILKEFEK